MDVKKNPIVSQMTKDGGRRIGKYILTKKLGSGQFGVVWQGLDTETKETYAVKQIKRAQFDKVAKLRQLLETEASVMQQIDHPNILHLYDFLQSSNNYYLVLKLCNQGTFNDYMKEKNVKFFEEKDALYFFQQIMNGFYELRKHKVLHRDFKLDNIFMNDETVVIGDFGFAKSGAEMGSTKVGTPLTMAPEILFSSGQGLIYTSKADLWSIGVVFYQILFGQPPYYAENLLDLQKELLRNTGDNIKYPRPVSEEAKNLLKRLLTVDPKARIEWADFFNHPFFTKARENRDEDVKKIFGQIGLMQSRMMKKEFNDNKKLSKNEKDVQFKDLEQLEKEKPGIKPKNYQEEIIKEDEDEAILEQSVIHQIFFRYCHELNKVYFLIYASKKFQAFLKSGTFRQAKEIIMNLSVLFLKKAMVINNLIVLAVSDKVNLFNMMNHFFKIFLNSESYKEIVEYCTNTKASMTKHLDLILRRAQQNHITIRYHNILSAKETKVEEVEKRIAEEYNKFTELNLLPTIKDNEHLKRDYFVFLFILNYAFNSQKLFYYLSKEAKPKKFNWNGFYYIIERSSTEELRSHIAPTH